MAAPVAEASARAMSTPALDVPVAAPAVLDALRTLVGEVGSLVGSVGRDHWHAASPCPDLPAGDLVGHLVGGLAAFTRVAEGDDAPDFDAPALDPVDASRAYRDAGTAAVTAWAAPGRLDAVYAMPWGEMLGAQLVGFLVLEQAVHGWDLARALGRAADLDDTAVAVAEAVAHAMVTPALRVPGMFGPEVGAPPDAGRLDRLAAFLGRRP